MWKFVKSSSSKDNWYEHNNKEICLIGRSNVGKSSLINALANNNKLAKVSKTPGRTQLINYFQNENGTIIVDLPGYGYANISLAKQELMFNMIDEYFLSKKANVVFILIDSRIGITTKDEEIIQYLDQLNCNIKFILTKSDKANQSQMSKTMKNKYLQKNDYFICSIFNKNQVNKVRNYINNL